jgi:hypothetical protein
MNKCAVDEEWGERRTQRTVSAWGWTTRCEFIQSSMVGFHERQLLPYPAPRGFRVCCPPCVSVAHISGCCPGGFVCVVFPD